MKKIAIVLAIATILGCDEKPKEGSDCGSSRFTFTYDCEGTYFMWVNNYPSVAAKYQDCSLDSDCEVIWEGLKCENVSISSCPYTISKNEKEAYFTELDSLKNEICQCTGSACHASQCLMIYATCINNKCTSNPCDIQHPCYDAGLPLDSGDED